MSSQYLNLKTIKAPLVLALCALFLSGCVVANNPPPQNRPATPTFAEGNWAVGDTAIFNFSSGRFTGSAVDTGNVVATGSYRYTGARSMTIDSYSVVQQKQIVANCIVVTTAQLNCTNDSGANFSLVKSLA